MQKLAKLTCYSFDNWTKSLPRQCFVDRDKAILAQCEGRTVLHIGAADAPFEMDKGRAGQLLHQKVQRVAERVVGVDVDASAVKALKKFGIDDITIGDICSDESLFAGESFDIVLCCDVIEHVLSAGLLLTTCRRFMRTDSKIVVTTINGTALKPVLRALQGRESVHHDHVAYYSFATLGRLMTMVKLQPTEFGVFAYPTVSRLVGTFTERLMRVAPGIADGIMLNARVG